MLLAISQRWCTVLLLALMLFALPCAQSDGGEPQVQLTAQERAYLDKLGSITFCVDPDWVPFERINEKGEHEGIAADLLRLVASRLGIKLELIRTKTWADSLALSKSGQCHLLSFLNSSPEREKWLLFTEPLFTDPNVFITRVEHPFITDPAGLINESIVFPRGTAMEELIRRDYHNLKVLLAPSESEVDAIRMVENREADLTLRSLIVAAYTIRKEGHFNLKISGQLPDYTNKLRIGVIKSEPMLRDILNKAIRSITAQERGRIVNNHVTINVQTATDYKLLVKISGIFLLLLAAAGCWVWHLHRVNDRLARLSQTDMLTQIPNRTHIDKMLLREHERARRYKHSFSIIMIDLDHFKLVNDELGHLTGDRILVAMAQIFVRSLRNFDMVGRWGGEEFLILCPETDEAAAKLVAERIRQAVKEFTFVTARVHTISAGVAMQREGETPDEFLRRADAALYSAKRDGRDCVRPI